MDYFLGAYKKYADFTGRARRKEYWMFILFYLIAVIVLSIIDGVIGTFSMEAGAGLLSSIFLLGSLVPQIAITARRLHDINKSGWWQLLVIVPFIGAIVLFIFYILKGTDGDNRFGVDPLLGE